MTAEPDPSFFSDRGITEEIRQARPYVWWTPENPDPAKEPFADLSRGQRAHITKVINQTPGWAITRYPPPMVPELPHIYPELRPLDPVKTKGPKQHWHGVGPEPEGLHDLQRLPGKPDNHINRGKDPKHPKPDVVLKYSPIDPDTGKPEQPKINVNAHKGVKTEELHWHQDFAKYVFPPGGLVDKKYEHDHATGWKTKAAAKRPDIRAAHVAKRGKAGHDGVDVEGSHWHTVREKAGDDYLAARIDVHPLGVQRILDAPVVFFVIEGCIKADAVLKDGGAVFSVPSVTLWDCPELQRFAAEYLFDKTVVIVPDADWRDKPKVINQAMLCQNALVRAAVPNVLVAAPPATYNDHDTKGVDDFIGHDGHLEDLLVIDSKPATGVWEWIASKRLRIDRALRDYEVVLAVSTVTRSKGELVASLQSVAKVLGITDRHTVPRAIKSLEQLGALTHSGRLDIKRDWFSRHYEWEEKPTITLIEELRSTESREKRLYDVVHLPLRAPEGAHA